MVSGGSSMQKKKTSKGRKKIEIKKIEETNSRQVTFSKRRAGLFKKASELCVLTGAQVAILVNSPGGKVFTFGHPNADLLVDRYLNENNKDTTARSASENPPPPLQFNFNQHFVELSSEKKRRERIPARRSGGLAWYDEAVDGMAVEELELERYICSLEQLKKKVLTRADELAMIKKLSMELLDIPTTANISPALGSNVFEMGWDNNIDQTVDIPTNTNNSPAFEMGWNNNMQTAMDINPTNTNMSPATLPLGLNEFEIGWNDDLQMVDLLTNANKSPALNVLEMGWSGGYSYH